MRYRDNLMDFDRAIGINDDFCMLDDVPETPAAASTPLAPVPATASGSSWDSPRGTTSIGAMTPGRALPSTPGGLMMTPANGSRPRRARRNTIFSEDCTVQKMTLGKLEEFFQAKSTVLDMGPRASTGSVRSLINDAK